MRPWASFFVLSDRKGDLNMTRRIAVALLALTFFAGEASASNMVSCSGGLVTGGNGGSVLGYSTEVTTPFLGLAVPEAALFVPIECFAKYLLRD